MNTLKEIYLRISKYMQNTKHTEIIPLPIAIAFVVMSILAMVFFIRPPHVESEGLNLNIISEHYEDNPYPLNPLATESMFADQHDSEELIPAVPKLPEGITLDPNFNAVLNDPARTEPYQPPEPLQSVRIKPAEELPEGHCSEWYDTALDAGWQSDQLQKLGHIIYKESSCQHDVANKTYSYGLVQIEWSAHYKWLESEFGITEREELYDPYTNLLVGKWLFDYADIHYGCGWQPWYMSGDWC